MIVIRLLLTLSILLLTLSCAAQDNQSQIVESYNDNAAYPYKFKAIDESPATNRVIIPADMNNDGKMESFAIQNSYRKNICAFYFYPDYVNGRSLLHFLIDANKISDYQLFDLDHDNIMEVGLTYTYQDTLWFDVIHFHNGRTLHQPIVVGEDSNGNGYWDGVGDIDGFYDYNDDGYDEVLINCLTGYDIYPRKIICYDVHNKKILWENCTTSNTTFGTNYSNIISKLEGALIFATSAILNGAECGEYSDNNSALFYYDRDGKIIWSQPLGSTFHYPQVELFDFDNDNELEIMATFEKSQEPISEPANIQSGFIVLNLQGLIIDTMLIEDNRFISNFTYLEEDNLAQGELFISTSKHEIYRYNNNLELVQIYNFTSITNIIGRDSYLGPDEINYLAQSADGKYLLLDNEFNIAAIIEAGNSIHAFKTKQDPDKFNISINYANSTILYSIEKSPWITIFRQHPIQSQYVLIFFFVLAFFYITTVSLKNRVIFKQKKELNITLNKLVTTQKKLIEAEKYKQIKDIAGGFAHEIRNALFPAKSLLNKIKPQLENDQKLNKYITLTSDSVTRAVELTELIMRYTKVDSDKAVENVNLKKLIEEVIELNLSRTEKIIISINLFENNNISAQGNYQQFLIVFNNLLLNSLDAFTDVERDNKIEISYTETDNDFIITFTDNGLGIEPENIDKIFDPFFSTKPNTGTGVGLSISKKIIEMYDGSMEVTSQLNTGTTFKIKLKK